LENTTEEPFTMLDLAVSLLIAQANCPGLSPDRDIPEIHKVSERILGKTYPIMFIIFGKTEPSEDYPVIVFCSGSDTSVIKNNPDYQHIEIFNQEVDFYLKTK
jgi:hypothetical protein